MTALLVPEFNESVYWDSDQEPKVIEIAVQYSYNLLVNRKPKETIVYSCYWLRQSLSELPFLLSKKNVKAGGEHCVKVNLRLARRSGSAGVAALPTDPYVTNSVIRFLGTSVIGTLTSMTINPANELKIMDNSRRR